MEDTSTAYTIRRQNVLLSLLGDKVYCTYVGGETYGPQIDPVRVHTSKSRWLQPIEVVTVSQLTELLSEFDMVSTNALNDLEDLPMLNAVYCNITTQFTTHRLSTGELVNLLYRRRGPYYYYH